MVQNDFPPKKNEVKKNDENETTATHPSRTHFYTFYNKIIIGIERKTLQLFNTVEPHPPLL